MRKVIMALKMKVILSVDEGTTMDEVMSGLIVLQDDKHVNADVDDTEVIDYEVIDSK